MNAIIRLLISFNILYHNVSDFSIIFYAISNNTGSVIATSKLPTTTIFAAVFGDVFESSAKFKVIAAGGMHDRIYVEIFNVSSTGSAYIIPNVISGNAISFRKSRRLACNPLNP